MCRHLAYLGPPLPVRDLVFDAPHALVHQGRAPREMVVAKDNQVHHRLSAQFERRDVKKEYHALVWRHLEFESDFIETYVKVHPKHREKMLEPSRG